LSLAQRATVTPICLPCRRFDPGGSAMSGAGATTWSSALVAQEQEDFRRATQVMKDIRIALAAKTKMNGSRHPG
jgi:hypothetical protein